MHAGRLFAFLLLFAHLVHQVLAQGVTGHAEFLPPVGQDFFDLADIGTQTHKVKGRPKACLLHQTKGGTTHPLLETRLHDPNLAHVAGQLAAARDIADAGVKHVINGIHQRRVRMLAVFQATRPAIAHIGPQHTGQQKAGRHRFVFADPAIRVFECCVDKGLLSTLHHHIEQRVNTACQPQFFQLLNRRQRMAGLQKLEHFIEQTALRNIGQQLV